MIHFEGQNNMNKVNNQPQINYDLLLPTDDLQNMVATLTERADREMTDRGTFRKIEESITNDSISSLGDIKLSIRPASQMNNETKRILATDVYSESGDFVTQKTLASGTRQNILQTLKDESFMQDYKKFLVDCSTRFILDGID